MKQITDEQIRSAARLASKGIFTSTNAAADFETGWEEGAQWMRSQMEEQTPQSAEVMTLEECKQNVAHELGNSSFEEMLYWKSSSGGFAQPEAFDMIAELYASQFKAKSEALQAELEKVKAENEIHKKRIGILQLALSKADHPQINSFDGADIDTKSKFSCYEIHAVQARMAGCSKQCKECADKESIQSKEGGIK